MSKTQEQSNYSRTLDLLDKQGQYIDKNSQMPTNHTFHSKVKLHTQGRSESQTLFSSMSLV